MFGCFLGFIERFLGFFLGLAGFGGVGILEVGLWFLWCVFFGGFVLGYGWNVGFRRVIL